MTRVVAALALAGMMTSCTSPEPAPPPSAEATTATEPVSSVTTGAEARSLRLVGCDPAVPEVEIVCESYDLIKRHYVDQVSDANLARAATRGVEALEGTSEESELVCAAPAPDFLAACELALVEADSAAEAAEAMVFGLATHGLDPNSVYLDQEALRLLEEEQEGAVEGIGALVSAEDRTSGRLCSVITETCRLYVVSTVEGAPAREAGLLPDDVVTAVDGEVVTGWTVDEITASVRGPEGTDVVLTIERGGDVLDITITREEFVVPAVSSEVVEDAGYVDLNVFTENADELFADALDDLLAQGIDALVVDLRNNPGGLLDTAVEVVSKFLPDGDVVVTESPDSSIAYPVSGDTTVPSDLEVVVVVNGGSASASEVVSAVLQERGRAAVVGENTFGKNTVQQRFALSNGGALKLTIARWLTPGGLDFGDVGVTPDTVNEISVELPVEEVVQEALTSSLTLGGEALAG